MLILLIETGKMTAPFPMPFAAADAETLPPSSCNFRSDVPLYATGAASSAVHGVMEQNEIFNLITSALNLFGKSSNGQGRNK